LNGIHLLRGDDTGATIYAQEAHHSRMLDDLIISLRVKNRANKKITGEKRHLQKKPAILPTAANGYAGQKYFQPFLAQGKFDLGFMLAAGVDYIPGKRGRGKMLGGRGFQSGDFMAKVMCKHASAP
jgi:hypothetical protein